MASHERTGPDARAGGTPPRKEYASRIEVHPDYYDLLVRLRGETPGVEIAQKTGLIEMEVTRFFHEDPAKRRITDRSARAICGWLKVPYPVHSIRNLEESRWIEAGQELAELDPEGFTDLVLAAKEAAAAARASVRKQSILKKIRGRIPGRGSDPGDTT